MPTTVPNPALHDDIKITVVSTVNGQQGQMTCGYNVQSIVTGGATLQEICSSFLLVVRADILACQPLTVLFGGVLAELYNSANSTVTQSVASIDGTSPGTGGGSLIPTQVAPVIQKKTGLAGRKNNGRMYFPFLSSTFVSAIGELNGAGNASLNQVSIDFLGPIVCAGGTGTSTLEPVLFRKPVKGTPLVTTFLAAFQPSQKMGTQRRRGDYGRPNPVL